MRGTAESGSTGSVPVRLIDLDDLSNNVFMVSEDVRYGTSGHVARFDVVLWVNGFPLVVGELKTPVNPRVSWVQAATELVETYQVDWPPSFVSNVLTFATEGRQFRYAGVGTPVQHWHTWGAVQDHPCLADVIAEQAGRAVHPVRGGQPDRGPGEGPGPAQGPDLPHVGVGQDDGDGVRGRHAAA